MEEKSRIQLLYNTSIISGVFCLIVSLLLLLNYLQFSGKKPLDSPALTALVERLSEDPHSDQLKEEIRDLDLLARKAYFNSQWQIRTGSYLLLFGAIVFAVSLRYYHSLRSKIEEPEESQEKARGGILTQKWILSTGSVLILVALGAAFLSVNQLEAYGTGKATAEDQEASGAEDQIEVIDISATSEKDQIPEESPGEFSTPGTDTETEAMESRVVKRTVEETAVKEQVVLPANIKFPSEEEILAQHNSFRGPWGNGVSYHKNIPVSWDGASGKSVLWKVEIPTPGFNSPAIWKDLIFLSGADESAQVIYCYDRNTGTLKWQAETGEIPGSPARKPDVTEDTGLAASGVTTDGNMVYAIFATGDVVAFTTSGKRVWAKNLGVPDNHYGHSSSLLVWKDKLLIQFDSNKGGRVLALNVLSGETIWDTKRLTGISWASPILVKKDGKFQMVLSAEPLVAGYDIETGKELWSLDCMMGEVGPSPAYGSGVVYAANEYAKLVAINLSNPSEILWQDDEFLPEVASPVTADGLLFIATSYGVVALYDSKSGEKYWEQEYGQGFYSSPMIADGKIYALDMDGVMYIFKLSKEFSLAGKASLGETAFATPAFMEGRIYLRGKEHLFCIGN